MVSFYANARLRSKIILLVAVPLLGMSIVSYQLLHEHAELRDNTQRTAQLLNLAIHISDALHEQQRERGTTAVFLSSGGTKLREQVPVQRQSTDTKLRAFKSDLEALDRSHLTPAFERHLDAYVSDLALLDAMRTRIDGLSIAPKDATGYYTTLNAKAIAVVNAISHVSNDPKIVIDLVGYTNLLQGKEYAGIERAIAANGFSSGLFTPEAIERLREVVAAQNVYAAIFLSHASAEEAAAFQEVMQSPEVKETARLRAIALNGGLTGELEGVTGDYWFETITKKIDGLKRAEQKLSAGMAGHMQQIEAEAEALMQYTIAGTLIGMVMTLALSILVTRSITRPIRTLQDAMTDIAGGNLDDAAPYNDQTNEIGQMAQAVEVFRQNGLEKRALEAKAKEAEIQAAAEKKRMMKQMASDFEGAVQGIITSVTAAATELYQTAESMQNIVASASAKSGIVATASTQASGNVQNVSAAMEEMSASVLEIASQVNKSTSLVNDAVAQTTQADNSGQALTQAVQQISGILQFIQTIAEQINLLALNATIESARAGDAGKGFAVVASEVKSLASQTTRATEDIASQIENVQRTSTDVMQVLKSIQDMIGSINQFSSGIASAVEEQSATTRDISSNMQHASRGVQEINSNITEVSQGISDADFAAQEVLKASQMLSQQSELLNEKVKEFLHQLAA